MKIVYAIEEFCCDNLKNAYSRGVVILKMSSEHLIDHTNKSQKPFALFIRDSGHSSNYCPWCGAKIVMNNYRVANGPAH